jgi:hypothetical protein
MKHKQVLYTVLLDGLFPDSHSEETIEQALTDAGVQLINAVHTDDLDDRLPVGVAVAQATAGEIAHCRNNVSGRHPHRPIVYARFTTQGDDLIEEMIKAETEGVPEGFRPALQLAHPAAAMVSFYLRRFLEHQETIEIYKSLKACWDKIAAGLKSCRDQDSLLLKAARDYVESAGDVELTAKIDERLEAYAPSTPKEKHDAASVPAPGPVAGGAGDGSSVSGGSSCDAPLHPPFHPARDPARDASDNAFDAP